MGLLLALIKVLLAADPRKRLRGLCSVINALALCGAFDSIFPKVSG